MLGVYTRALGLWAIFLFLVVFFIFQIFCHQLIFFLIRKTIQINVTLKKANRLHTLDLYSFFFLFNFKDLIGLIDS